MKRTVFIGIFLLSAYSVIGQISRDTIEIKKTLGTVFRQNNKNLTPGRLLDITRSNPEAYKEMKIAKNNYDVGFAIGFAGGALIGWPIGTAIAGGDPEWILAGIGAGLIVISIPFSLAYTKHAKKAVKFYNSALKNVGLHNIDLNFGLTYNGFAVRMTF